MKTCFSSFILLFSFTFLLCTSCSTVGGTKKPEPTGVDTLPPAQSETPPPTQPTGSTETTTQTTPPVDNGQAISIDQLPKKKGYPFAIKTKWDGLVKSPYAQDKTLVDVHSMTSGSFARCPHTGKIFVVP